MHSLKELRESRGLYQKDVAAAIGVDRTTYVKYERGTSEPNFQILCKLASFFNVSIDSLVGYHPMSPENSIRGVPDPDEIHRRIAADAHLHAIDWVRKYPNAPASTGGVWIPVLGRVAAGIPIEAVENIEDYEEISMDMAVHGEHFALRISGDSMEPRILDGDVVIVKRQQDCNTGDVAVVLVNGSDATVKRIKKRPEGLMLIPNNPAYEPMFYTNEEIDALPVRVLGKVVELRRKL